MKRSLWWYRLRWRWPVLVWIALAGVALWLYDNGGEFMRINGMVEVVSETVAPLEAGRLDMIHVRPGESVEAGDVVAEIDTTFIDEEIALLEATQAADRSDAIRQFVTASQRLEEEKRDRLIGMAEARSELSVLEQELEEQGKLVDEGLTRMEDLTDIRSRVAVLQEQLRLYPAFIENLEEQIVELETLRVNALAVYGSGNAETGNPGSLEILYRRREAHFLKARHSGTVSQLLQQSGEVIRAGDGVVEIIMEKPPTILAFMNETDLRPVAVGDMVEVEPVIGGSRVQAEIMAISPNIIALPDRASPIPNRVVRGRRLELDPKAPLDLPPGSGVVVLLPGKERMWRSIFGGWSP